MLSSELERLKGVSEQLKQTRAEADRLRDENSRLRAELDRMDKSWGERHNTEINRVQSEYERKISSVVSEKDQFSNRKISEIGNEIDRLNELLLRYKKDNESLKIQNEELVGLMNKRDTEIRNLQMQIEALQNQLGEQAKVSRGLSEKDMKIASLERELEQARQEITRLQEYLRKTE